MADAKQMNKSAVFQHVAERDGPYPQAGRVRVRRADGRDPGTQLAKKGPGVFVLPGLVKIRLVHKPATKARKGINPFTKEEVDVQGEAGRKLVKAQPLKGLKDMTK